MLVLYQCQPLQAPKKVPLVRYLSTDYFGVLVATFMIDWLIQGQDRTLKVSDGEII